MEILPESRAQHVPVMDIIAPPPTQWELRLIIYEVDGIANRDELTDASDLYVRAQVQL